MSADAPEFVGIDVSKEWVDVAVRSTGDTWRVNQDQEGRDALILRFQALNPQCVVMEATGGYEMPCPPRSLPPVSLLPSSTPVRFVTSPARKASSQRRTASTPL